jgi:quinoprotein glucose dehydrogenase
MLGKTSRGRMLTLYRVRKFLDPDGYPAIAPPWGTLNAIDLKTGKYLWKIPFGEYPELAKQGMKNTGTELMAGRL